MHHLILVSTHSKNKCQKNRKNIESCNNDYFLSDTHNLSEEAREAVFVITEKNKKKIY